MTLRGQKLLKTKQPGKYSSKMPMSYVNYICQHIML